MKIFLYTDIDGVLCLGSEQSPKMTKWGWLYSFNKKAVQVYNEILVKTGADIIISSDWKYSFTLEQLGGIFLYQGIIKTPVGITDAIGDRVIQRLEEDRAAEILRHVEIHKPDKWVAIDDMNLSSWIGTEHFVELPRFMEGVKQTNKKEKIIKLLM